MTAAARTIWRAFLLQLMTARRSPGHLLILVVTPLMSMIFLSLAVEAHRQSAIANAVLAPGLIGLWLSALGLAGEVVVEDRWLGRLELLIATRVSLSLVVFGRVLLVGLFGTLTLAESWLVAALCFGQVLPITDPAVFTLGVVVTCFATVGTATLLAAVFVSSRGMETLQTSMTYPFYILGGVVVPAATLPGWLHPISWLVFLSWSADLLRGAVRGGTPDWIGPAAIIMVLGAGALGAGMFLIRLVVDRSRRDGTVGEA